MNSGAANAEIFCCEACDELYVCTTYTLHRDNIKQEGRREREKKQLRKMARNAAVTLLFLPVCFAFHEFRRALISQFVVPTDRRDGHIDG